jgi:hypothetical protein
MVGNDVKAEWWPMNRRYRGRHRDVTFFGFRRDTAAAVRREAPAPLRPVPAEEDRADPADLPGTE